MKHALKTNLLILSTFAILASSLPAADSPAKPKLKITPGKVIIPFDAMHRWWGELISVDLATRTGTFRNEGDESIVNFTVMPYAELLHHAANGDLQDFRIGERAIFRMHENEKGEWVWLTYIQDEMNMMNGHGEYFFVDQINATTGKLTTTWAKGDMTFVREKGVVIETDKETRYWKAGQPAKFTDIKTGDKLRTKTHGIGKGKVRMAWEVFLDDESLLKYQSEQKTVHESRIKQQGAPGYVDEVSGDQLSLTLFHEGEVQVKQLKPKSTIRIAPAGIDRKPTAEPTEATVESVKMVGRLCQVTLKLAKPSTRFQQAGLMRLWAIESPHR